jgi:hypothetical protein
MATSKQRWTSANDLFYLNVSVPLQSRPDRAEGALRTLLLQLLLLRHRDDRKCPVVSRRLPSVIVTETTTPKTRRNGRYRGDDSSL